MVLRCWLSFPGQGIPRSQGIVTICEGEGCKGGRSSLQCGHREAKRLSRGNTPGPPRACQVVGNLGTTFTRTAAITTTQEIAAKLANQGMNRDEMISFIYGVTTCACLDEIQRAVDAVIAAA